MSSKTIYHFSILFLFISVSKTTSGFGEKTKSQKIQILEQSMDLRICNGIFTLIRFFYESNRNIFRTSSELSLLLTPVINNDLLNDSNSICYGQGFFFTNKLKQDRKTIGVRAVHNFQWKTELEVVKFSEKYSIKIECPGNKSTCRGIMDMLKGNDLDLDIGRFHVGGEHTQTADGSVFLFIFKYNDSSSMIQSRKFLI